MTAQVIDCPTHGACRLLARIDAERSLCLNCYTEARARYRATGVAPVWMKEPEPRRAEPSETFDRCVDCGELKNDNPSPRCVHCGPIQREWDRLRQVVRL